MSDECPRCGAEVEEFHTDGTGDDTPLGGEHMTTWRCHRCGFRIDDEDEAPEWGDDQ